MTAAHYSWNCIIIKKGNSLSKNVFWFVQCMEQHKVICDSEYSLSIQFIFINMNVLKTKMFGKTVNTVIINTQRKKIHMDNHKNYFVRNVIPNKMYLLWRLIGLLPVKNNESKVGLPEFSPWLGVYSFLITVVTSVWTAYWNLNDLKDKTSERFSQVITSVSITDQALIVSAGIVINVAALINFKKGHYRNLVKLLKYFDNACNYSHERKGLSRFITLSVHVYLILLFLSDIVIWKKLLHYINYSNYIPLYYLYFVTIALQQHFVYILKLVRNRFCFLNNKLKYLLSSGTFCTYISHIPSVESRGEQKILMLPLVCDLHLLLCDAVAMMNTMFGWQLFVCLISLFTHTVVTPYYLFIVIFKSVSPFSASYKLVYHKIYIFSQVVWVLTHLSCLIYLVYYSHKTTEEANKTAVIVSQAVGKNHNASLTKEMEAFLLQLKYHEADVSVLGLYRLNLPVITSVGSTVAMYLFILIQFENS